MVLVLLTRPLAASENLAQELKRHGYESVIEPLLVIESLATPRPDVSSVRAIMITSGNTLEAGQDLVALFDFPCFCVGQRTAAKAHATGFRHVQSASSDGIELARLIGASLENSFPGEKSAILHISGQEIDSRAQEELARRGHKVAVWPIYAARPVSSLTERTSGLLKRQEIEAVLVFSIRTAETLKALLGQNRLSSCCEGLTAIGLSEAVAHVLQPLPWKALTVATVPTEDAMIDCLKRIFPVA